MSFSGVQSVSGTLVADATTTVTFGEGSIPIRYAYITVTNEAESGSDQLIFVRTDGGDPVDSLDFATAVNPNETVTIANGLPSWTQAANVIATGTYVGSTPGTGTPQENNPLGSSVYGQTASPGTIVKLISGGTPPYTITGTG